jgi:hypothetical protein
MKERTATIIIVLCIFTALYAFTFQPSNNRTWSPDQQILTTARFDGEMIHLANVRNNTYRTPKEYDVRYYNASYNISQLKRAWFVVEPFSEKGAAHTFMSFEFEGERYLAISVEIRKEEGESFSPIKGLFRQYELMYVIADEEDVIKLRSNYRNDTVYLYPANTTQQRAQLLLLSMLERANDLAAHPEFYNTLVSTCTTNIVKHVNLIVPHRIMPSWKILAPAYADEYALEIGLLDIEETSIAEARQRYRINERARNETMPFSERIRRYP